MARLEALGLEPLVLVFNNDTFRDYYGVVPWATEPEVRYEGYPHLVLYLRPVRGGSAALDELRGERVVVEAYDSSGRLVLREEAELRRSKGSWIPDALLSEIELAEKLPDVDRVRVEVAGREAWVRPQPQVRVHGRVTDFEGNPREAYVELVMPYGLPAGVAIAKTGRDGYYEMHAPSAVYHHAFVCDGGYGTETLEFYAWWVPVEPPGLRLDARFDRVEIYRLSAMETPERTLVVEFVPMDIAHTTRRLERAYREGGREALSRIPLDELIPPLERRDLRVLLGGRELEVLDLSRRRYASVVLMDRGAADWRAPAYVLEALIPRDMPPGTYDLRLEVDVEYGGVRERGESVLFGVRVW